MHQQKDVNRYTKVKKGKNNTREKKRFKILQVSNYTSLSKIIDTINQELLIHFIYCRKLGNEIVTKQKEVQGCGKEHHLKKMSATMGSEKFNVHAFFVGNYDRPTDANQKMYIKLRV